MNFLKQLLGGDPVKLTPTGKLLATLFCFSAIFIAAVITHALSPNSPILIASMGASAIILFIIPNSPLAQPWAFAGGQLISALVGMSCALFINDIIIAATAAVAGSVFLMLFTRCLHPPAAATALTPVMSGSAIISLGYYYAVVPIAINVAVMLAMAIIINRWLMGYDYPASVQVATQKSQTSGTTTFPVTSRHISETVMQQALAQTPHFMDVNTADLCKLFTQVQLQQGQEVIGKICCADIMHTPVISVEYGTEVEDAWQLMLQHQLKALPVLDNVRRVIGIVTWYDFFKFIDLHAYQNIDQKIRAFIRRTPDISTQKPEAVGHLMTSTVVTLAESCHIVGLIPLLVEAGHRQVPIVNNEKRLVGMIYQADLIAALYQQRVTESC